MTIDEALRIAREECHNEYAVAYFDAIPEAVEADGLDAYEVQVRYIIHNLSSWRGARAAECKKVIREWLAQRERAAAEHRQTYGF